MKDNKIIQSKEDAEIFIKAILNPPAPNEKLKQCFIKYEQWCKNNSFK